MKMRLTEKDLNKFKDKLYNLYKYNASLQSTNSKFRFMTLLGDVTLHYKFTHLHASEIEVLHFEVELRKLF